MWIGLHDETRYSCIYGDLRMSAQYRLSTHDHTARRYFKHISLSCSSVDQIAKKSKRYNLNNYIGSVMHKINTYFNVPSEPQIFEHLYTTSVHTFTISGSRKVLDASVIRHEPHVAVSADHNKRVSCGESDTLITARTAL